MIGHILALAVPITGVLIVVALQHSPSTKPGTSTKPEGSDQRRTEEH